MRGERVLVTGSSGFVGHHLARAWHALGAHLTGAGIERSTDLLEEGSLEGWQPCDVTDPEQARSAVHAARPGIVVHLAGQSSAAISFDDPLGTYRTNALGTASLLEAVRREAPTARVLVIGTSESYGPQPHGSRVSEASPLAPVSPYGSSKAAADSIAEFYARARGLHVIRTRSFHHIGPGQAPRYAIPGFAAQIAAMERGDAEPVLRVGSLDVIRDVTDVRDVVEAYRLLIERGRAGVAYNVCGGEGIVLSEIGKGLCVRASVSVRVEVDPARIRPVDVPYLVGDPERISSEIGWRASRPLDASLDEVLDEWRGNRSAPASH